MTHVVKESKALLVNLQGVSLVIAARIIGRSKAISRFATADHCRFPERVQVGVGGGDEVDGLDSRQAGDVAGRVALGLGPGAVSEFPLGSGDHDPSVAE